MKEAINSIVNLLTYMALGVMLLVYGISMYHMASPYEVLIFFGAFLGLLLLAVVIGYTGNRAFPNFEMERYRVFFFFVETIGIILIACVGIGLRLEAIEKTGIILDNWNTYQTASAMMSVDSAYLPDVIKYMFIEKPDLFFHSLLSCATLLICDCGEITLLYLQLVLYVLFATFTYRVARKVSGRLSGMITFALMMCMPSLVASVGFINEKLGGLMLVFLQIWIFYSLQKRKHINLKSSLKVLFYSIDGLILAAAIFAMPENIIVFIGELIYILILNEHSRKHIVSTISLFLSTIFGFLILLYFKGLYLIAPFDMLFESYIKFFENGGTSGITGNMSFMADNLTNAYAMDNYADPYLLHNLPMENEILYGNILLMAVCCLIFLWTLGERVYFVLNLFFLLSFAYGAAFTHDNFYHINIMPYLIILTGVLFEKIYVSFKIEPKKISKMMKRISEINLSSKEIEVIDLNKDESIDALSESVNNAVDDKKSDAEALKQSDAENLKMDEVEETEEQKDEDEVPTVEKILGKKTEEIKVLNPEEKLENPLPVPARREHKELDYDILVDENDDFDL